jgi:hypothetical protein
LRCIYLFRFLFLNFFFVFRFFYLLRFFLLWEGIGGQKWLPRVKPVNSYDWHVWVEKSYVIEYKDCATVNEAVEVLFKSVFGLEGLDVNRVLYEEKPMYKVRLRKLYYQGSDNHSQYKGLSYSELVRVMNNTYPTMHILMDPTAGLPFIARAHLRAVIEAVYRCVTIEDAKDAILTLMETEATLACLNSFVDILKGDYIIFTE